MYILPKNVIQYYRQHNSIYIYYYVVIVFTCNIKVFTCFLDESCVFDRVKYWTQCKKLIQRGFNGGLNVSGAMRLYY